MAPSEESLESTARSLRITLALQAVRTRRAPRPPARRAASRLASPAAVLCRRRGRADALFPLVQSRGGRVGSLAGGGVLARAAAAAAMGAARVHVRTGRVRGACGRRPRLLAARGQQLRAPAGLLFASRRVRGRCCDRTRSRCAVPLWCHLLHRTHRRSCSRARSLPRSLALGFAADSGGAQRASNLVHHLSSGVSYSSGALLACATQRVPPSFGASPGSRIRVRSR